ncbi:hypothetical protein GQX74_011315 [Glossina fuscipes]|nr:hypothetical protein GQX74_011315 [Glossina fuscipes]
MTVILTLSGFCLPVGIYAKKYEWAARPSTPSGGSLHLDLHPPPMQIGGDCSLWIRSATLDFDDGLWECQVTASDFTTQDALTSQPVRLVVRVGHVSTIRPPPGNHVQPSAALRRKPSKPKLPMAPQRPRLEYEGTHVPPGHNITVDSGSLATAKCVSHYGNPPATLKWFLETLIKRSLHIAPVSTYFTLHDAPTIRLIGSPEIDLEEDKDALVLRCVADANPPASIVWRRAGRSEIASLQETLQLRPVGRRDAGLYTCQAQNSVGTSEQLSVQLDDMLYEEGENEDKDDDDGDYDNDSNDEKMMI